MIEGLFPLNFNTFLFAFLTLLWWMEFILFRPERRERETIKGQEEGSLSFQWILLAILLSLFLGSLLYSKEIGNSREPLAPLMRGVGTALYGLGLSIRYWSLILLGSHFSRKVKVVEEQPLVSVGPYRLLRHPSYTGLLLLNIGLHFYIGNILGILLATTTLSLALVIRMREEEGSMEKVLGDTYRHWKEERCRLVPWIY